MTGFVRMRRHISSTCAVAGFVGRVDHQADALPDAHLRDVAPPERGKRSLDRGTGRVEDPRTVRHLNLRLEPHFAILVFAGAVAANAISAAHNGEAHADATIHSGPNHSSKLRLVMVS